MNIQVFKSQTEQSHNNEDRNTHENSFNKIFLSLKCVLQVIESDKNKCVFDINIERIAGIIISAKY